MQGTCSPTPPGLLITLIAAPLALRPTTARRTWGLPAGGGPGATVQAGAPLAVGAYIFVEGIRRLFELPGIAITAVLVFGAIGLVANLIRTTGGRSDYVDMRAAFLEVLNDTLDSVAVPVAAGAIPFTG